MFSYFNNIKSIETSSSINSIDDLYNMIRLESEYSKQVNSLRKLEYGSEEYKSFKSKIGRVITPHGVFSKRNANSLSSLSGYLYFDIDNTKLTREFIINKYSKYITLLTRSIGGRGFSIFIKVNNLTIDNFNDCWNHISQIFIDLNIDRMAKGIARPFFIPFDYQVYLNKDVSFDFRQSRGIDLQDKLEANQNKKEYDTILNDTKNIIPINILKTQIYLRTQVNEINNLFKIENISDYIYIYIPPIIQDGKKHFYYKIYIYQLMYLNPDITLQQVYSFLHNINKYNTGFNPMDKKELIRLCSYQYSDIRESGDYTFLNKYMKTKKIHFIKNNNLTMKEKQVIAAKINGRLKTNQTIEQINEVKFYLETKNIKVTQNNVKNYFEEYYGETISIATIKRNWTKDVNYNFEDIIMETIPELIPNDRRIIDEEDFFN